jgi:hypothetical protein
VDRTPNNIIDMSHYSSLKESLGHLKIHYYSNSRELYKES